MAGDPGSLRDPDGAGKAPPQRILVLGAGGFIGRRVVQALADSDWAKPVAVLHRHSRGFPDRVEIIRLDARQSGAMKMALAGSSGVVNCIAGDAQTIVATARALFGAASSQAAPPRIVHLSTMMVYGSATGTVAETATLKGDWDDYSRAKTDVEEIARTYPGVVQLRPGIVYGPGSPIWSAWIARWLQEGRLGDLGAAGQGCCNLVHVDDVVSAVLRSLRAAGIEGEAFNLSLPDPPTWNEYFRAYAAALGCSCDYISPTRLWCERVILAPPLKVAQILAQKMQLGWHPPQPIRPWLLRLCRHPIRLAVGKAEQRLGMRWTPLAGGLQQTAAWFGSRAKPGAAPAASH
jgi:nucleoside-diphosphate-sugar epimerase